MGKIYHLVRRVKPEKERGTVWTRVGNGGNPLSRESTSATCGQDIGLGDTWGTMGIQENPHTLCKWRVETGGWVTWSTGRGGKRWEGRTAL